MKSVCLVMIAALWAVPAHAQQPIHASLLEAADSAARDAAPQAQERTTHVKAGKSPLFWAGLAAGVAGVTTATLGLTALRTEKTSTGNAPDGTYRACVAQRDSAIPSTPPTNAARSRARTSGCSGAASRWPAAARRSWCSAGTRARSWGQGSIGVSHRWSF